MGANLQNDVDGFLIFENIEELNNVGVSDAFVNLDF